MKYVVICNANWEYLSIEHDGFTRGNCMCYREPKKKYFNSLDDCYKAILAVGRDNLPLNYDCSDYASIGIYEAIINKYKTNDGRPYTTVDKGRLIETVRPSTKLGFNLIKVD